MRNLWVIGKIVSVIAALAGAIAIVSGVNLLGDWVFYQYYGETANVLFGIAANITILAYIAVAGVLLAFVFKIKS